MAGSEQQGQSGQLLIYKPDAKTNVQVRIDGQTVWLTQKLMAELYNVTVPTINEHIKGIYAEGELSPEATIRNFRIVQTEGNRSVEREIEHYDLDLIIAIGYRVRSTRGIHFRQWATVQLRELLIKGFVLDDERLKAGQTIGQDYFDELLARIRDIRNSERLFYKKVIDIYATSIDYDRNAEMTKLFFQTVQNKLHYAVHGHTAAEVIRARADAKKPTMGLTTWKNAPNGEIRKADVIVAKNYLTEKEMTELDRIVSMYLDYAEDQARNKKPMHMRDWVEKLNAFLLFHERGILTSPGKVSRALMEKHAHAEFEKFEARRLATEPSEFDRLVDESKRVQKALPPPTEADAKPKKKSRKKPS